MTFHRLQHVPQRPAARVADETGPGSPGAQDPGIRLLCETDGERNFGITSGVISDASQTYRTLGLTRDRAAFVCAPPHQPTFGGQTFRYSAGTQCPSILIKSLYISWFSQMMTEVRRPWVSRTLRLRPSSTACFATTARSNRHRPTTGCFRHFCGRRAGYGYPGSCLTLSGDRTSNLRTAPSMSKSADCVVRSCNSGQGAHQDRQRHRLPVWLILRIAVSAGTNQVLPCRFDAHSCGLI